MSPGWLAHQLCQEFLFHTLQEPSRLYSLVYIISFRHMESLGHPQEQRPVTMKILQGAYKIIYLPHHPGQMIYNKEQSTSSSGYLSFVVS